ncbi:MAG: efflux RND transporter periplasmic adaptor subunit [Candidatus Methylomirabilales bacterium]
MRRLLSLVAVVAAALLGTAGFYWFANGGRAPAYRTAAVERGSIVSSISATGTLNAVVTVQVGTQVSGTISALYADFNSPVKKGMLIARIDPEIFEAKVNQARADLEGAQAAVLNQRASLARAQADLANAQATVVKQEVAVRDARVKATSRLQLFKEGGISAEERDSAQAALDSAVAQRDAGEASVKASQAALEVARAQVASAEATVRQKRAALAQAEADLGRTYIRAPVDGVVISRNVDVGQTVAASLQAPTLFLIAQDLTKMQVDTNVDEADISRVALEQEATFTVDSYPGQTFRGRVQQVRQAPQVVQNVVTYNTVITVDNPDRKLKPGMTANVKILTAQRENTLIVPSAAFRYRPEGAGAAPAARPGAAAAAAGPAGARPGGGMRPGARGGEGQARVYVLQGGTPVERVVRVGLSDGQRTEILEGLQEGDLVIVGQAAKGGNSQPARTAPRLRL